MDKEVRLCKFTPFDACISHAVCGRCCVTDSPTFRAFLPEDVLKILPPVLLHENTWRKYRSGMGACVVSRLPGGHTSIINSAVWSAHG